MFTVLNNKNYQTFATLKTKEKFKFLKEIKENKNVNLHLNGRKHILHLKGEN